MNGRGQTAYDYLLGVVLLLVTIITVLSLFPQVFGTFSDPVPAEHEEMATRAAAEVIETNATTQSERTLAVTAGTFDDEYVETLRNRSGIPERRQLNVTLLDGSEPIESGGDERTLGQPTSTATRVVRLPRGSDLDRCTDGCRLVVRVW